LARSHETGLSRRIIGLGIDVHQQLGPELLESAYAECLCFELEQAAISMARQVPIPLVYKGARLECVYRLDIVAEGQVIIEVKSVEQLLPIHNAQLLTYLDFSGCRIGLLMNFNAALLKDGLRRIEF
jgi:GxxExxY protein